MDPVLRMDVLVGADQGCSVGGCAARAAVELSVGGELASVRAVTSVRLCAGHLTFLRFLADVLG